jgi:ABC-type glycerol-3-phosphate transport system substrate-binding protein
MLLFGTIVSVSAGGGKAGDSPAQGASQAAPGPFGKYNPSVEVTEVKNLGAGNLLFPPGDSIDNNVWTRYYEEVLGIKIKYAWTTNEHQYAQKVNISITSNAIPDIMTVNTIQLKMMYENGQLMDMTDILPQYLAPFTREVIYQDSVDPIKPATFDGRLYAIPLTGFGLMFGQFWNAAWTNSGKVANPTMEWVPVSIPFGPEGKAQTTIR